jgi:hypothetical protein
LEELKIKKKKIQYFNRKLGGGGGACVKFR